MRYEYTDDLIRKTAWSESEKRPEHSRFIEMAKQLDYE